MVYTLERRQWVPADLRTTFAFFERPQNLPRITPPSLELRILTPEPIVMARGLTLDYAVRILGVRRRWRSLIVEYGPPHGFRDVQLIGPYRSWDHRHRFLPADGGTLIEDVVVYEPPLGALGAPLNRLVIRRQLAAIFEYRGARIAALLGARVRAWTAVAIYGAPDNRACGHALTLLRRTGRAIHVRDVVADPLTWEELRHLAAMAGGVRHLLSVQAPAYRILGLDAADRTEPELLALMASDSSLLRRPIVVVDDLVLVGFDGEARPRRRT